MTNCLLYIDPGSGSLLFQLIIAGAVGVLFFFRTALEKIKLFTNSATTRIRSALQSTALHPFLIGLCFILYKAKGVFILYDLFTIILYLSVIIITIGLLLIVFFLSTKNLVKSAITLSVFLLLILFYESIYAHLLSLVFLQNNFQGIGYLILFIFLTATSLIWLTQNNLHSLNFCLNILFIILSLTESCEATYNYFENLRFENLTEGKKSSPPPHTAYETPVIYHILLDAYTSSSSLKKYFGYDNSGLEDFLRSNGFYIAGKAHSNTTATQLSMATTFNMDYQYNMDSLFNNDLLSTSEYRNAIKKSRIIRELTSRNYSLINLSIFDLGDSTKFLRSGLLADATNLFQLLIDGTRFASLIKRPSYIDFKTSVAVFDSLQKLPGKIDEKKVFVYAHVNMPHDSYCDSNGNPFNNAYQGNGNKKYIETVAYTNKLLMATVKKILFNSTTPPVIIIQGDHGSRMHDESEKHTVLSAYYFPDKDYRMLYDSISLVNTYRVICNKYFKENLKLLSDKRGYKKIN